MILSDRDIKQAIKDGLITIENFDLSRLQPSSYDVLLGDTIIKYNNVKLKGEYIDTRDKQYLDVEKNTIKISGDDGYILKPNEFILAVTDERVGIDDSLCYVLDGKSSLGRLGIFVHVTAGFIDPGNNLRVTLEIYNATNKPVKLYHKMPIGQVRFMQLSSPAERPYGHPELNSKYKDSDTVEMSRYDKNKF
jgi:dCTP deaminase